MAAAAPPVFKLLAAGLAARLLLLLVVVLAPSGATAQEGELQWVRFPGGSRQEYALGSGAKPWPLAEAECQLLGGHLATVRDRKLSTFLSRTFLGGNNANRAWIGGLRKSGDFRSFAWSDGSPFDVTFWLPNEPSSGNADAIMIGSAIEPTPVGGWSSSNPAKARPFICQRPIPCSGAAGEYQMVYGEGQRFAAAKSDGVRLFEMGTTASLAECKAACDVLDACVGLYVSCAPCGPLPFVTGCAGLGATGRGSAVDENTNTMSLLKIAPECCPRSGSELPLPLE